MDKFAVGSIWILVIFIYITILDIKETCSTDTKDIDMETVSYRTGVWAIAHRNDSRIPF